MHDCVGGMVFLACLMTLIGSGCSGRRGGDPVEQVPASAVIVEEINLAAMLKEAGVSFPVCGDSLSAEAAEVLSLVAPSSLVQQMKYLMPCFDGIELSRVVCFTSAEGADILVVPLADNDVLEKYLEEESGELDETDGLLVASHAGAVVAISDNRFCWVGPDLMSVIEARSAASHGNFVEIKGVTEFLRSDDVFNLAVNCGNSSLSYLGGINRWLCIGMKITPQSVSLSGKVVSREGIPDSIGANFEVIDTDFLRYTPERAPVVLAFGKFSGNVRGLSMLLDRFAPIYLDEADGTTALYAQPVSGSVEAVRNQTSGSWNVATMVHLPDTCLEAAIKRYKETAPTTLTNLDEGDVQWTYAVEENEYYFGDFHGNLVFSLNREIAPEFSGNTYIDDFEGLRAALIIDVPAGGVLAQAWNLPYGFTFKVKVDAVGWKARITFNGTSMPAFRTLLDMPQLRDFNAKARSMAGM